MPGPSLPPARPRWSIRRLSTTARTRLCPPRPATEWDPSIEALLTGNKRSEKVVCALAAGAWLLRPDYLAACQGAGAAAAGGGQQGVDPRPYEISGGPGGNITNISPGRLAWGSPAPQCSGPVAPLLAA